MNLKPRNAKIDGRVALAKTELTVGWAAEIACELARQYRVSVDPSRVALFVLCAWPGNGGAPELAPVFYGWDDAQWRKLAHIAEAVMMLSWACHRLGECRLGCPDEILYEMRATTAKRLRWNRVIGLAAMDVAEKLSLAGINTMILKGAPLAVFAYGAAGLRDVKDIDLLVSPDDAFRAGELLTSLGYLCEIDIDWLNQKSVLRALRQLTFRAMNGALEVDLHWKLTNDWVHAEHNKLDVHAGAETIDVFGRNVVWMNQDTARKAAEVNVAGSHAVEFKAAVDYVRTVQQFDDTAIVSTSHTEPSATVIYASLNRWITQITGAARLPAKAIFSELLYPQNNAPTRSDIWARNLLRLRNFSELRALAVSLASPTKTNLQMGSHKPQNASASLNTLARKFWRHP